MIRKYWNCRKEGCAIWNYSQPKDQNCININKRTVRTERAMMKTGKNGTLSLPLDTNIHQNNPEKRIDYHCKAWDDNRMAINNGCATMKCFTCGYSIMHSTNYHTRWEAH